MVEIALDSQRPGLDKPLNVAQNTGLSIRELADLIRLAVGYIGEVHYDHTKPDGALKKVMNDQHFREVFPNFTFTEFHQGIADTIAYYQQII